MTALVAILASEDAAEVAAGVARRLSGQAVVIPYDVLLQGWPVKPGDREELDLLTAKQVKLLTAGYVRAGFHVVLHGSFGEAGRGSEEGINTLLGLMRTVPGVHTLLVEARGAPGDGATAHPGADLTIELRERPADDAAAAIIEALPLEAIDAG